MCVKGWGDQVIIGRSDGSASVIRARGMEERGGTHAKVPSSGSAVNSSMNDGRAGGPAGGAGGGGVGSGGGGSGGAPSGLGLRAAGGGGLRLAMGVGRGRAGGFMRAGLEATGFECARACVVDTRSRGRRGPQPELSQLSSLIESLLHAHRWWSSTASHRGGQQGPAKTVSHVFISDSGR